MRPFGPKWWAGHQQGRRPVSRWRQGMGISVLLIVVLGWMGYRYLTDEVRLRRYAEQWLSEFTGGDASINRVEFSLFGGLHLVGVTIAVPESADFFPAATSLEDRALFAAGTVLLRLQPFSIITGDLAVPQIIAVNPRLTLVERAPDGTGNWEVMLARRKRSEKPGKTPGRLPDIRLRNVEVQQYRINERGRAGGTVQTFYAGAKPHPRQPQVYDLRITKIVAADDPQQWSGDAGQLEIDMQSGAVAGSLPSLSLDELMFAAPPEMNRWLEMLDLSGTVQAEMFRFDPQGGTQASLRLRQARLSVPIDEMEAGDVSAGRYIQFSNVAGTILFDQRQAVVEVEGLFRESPIRLSGRMIMSSDAMAGLTGLGLDLDVTATNVPLPRCDDDTSEPEKRFVHRWKRLTDFVKDFDGKGNVDLSLSLHKEPGAGKGIEFRGGKLVARGVSAAFYEFPYRLYGVNGEVHFLSSGRVELVRLTGTHGRGKAVISGEVGGFGGHDSVKLDIQGHNISLDADLLERLDEDDRVLAQKFLRSAMLDLDIHLERAAADPAGPRAPWQSRIDAAFLDGEFLYAEFPYPLNQLRGRVRIEGGAMRLDELTGRHGESIVRVSGVADREGARAGNIDVRLQAEKLALDETLTAAMPADIRDLYGQYALTGQANVSGRLYTETAGGPLRFDLGADLAGAELNLPEGGARLTDVEAALRVLPDRLEVAALQGRLGSSMVQVEGTLGLSSSRSGMDVHVHSEALELGEVLRSALPVALRDAYDSFAPRGQVRLDLRYKTGAPLSAASPPATSPALSQAAEYVATVEPLDCEVTFSKFPLPLREVGGRIVFTPEATRFEKITARHGETRLRLDGRLAGGPGPLRVHIDTLEARDLEFTPELRKAMPWRLKRLWRDLRPSGTCDLKLRNIEVVTEPDGQHKWHLTGKVDLKRAGLTAGAALTDVEGTLEGVVGFDRQFYANTQLHWKLGRVDGRLVTDAKARIERLLDGTVLKISDILGTLYGGALMGEIEVNHEVDPPSFGLSLTARDVSLEGFLNADDGPDAKPVHLKGLIQGTLALTGQFGRPHSRRGSGSVLIHDAQMAKLPMILGILQVVHMAVDDDNAFHDALFDFIVDGDDVVLDRIDLRGKAISMVGAGRVHVSDAAMHLVLLVGSPLNLPKLGVFSELLEGVARELMEVHVEGTLQTPLLRAEIARSIRKSLDTMTRLRAERGHPLPGLRDGSHRTIIP